MKEIKATERRQDLKEEKEGLEKLILIYTNVIDYIEELTQEDFQRIFYEDGFFGMDDMEDIPAQELYWWWANEVLPDGLPEDHSYYFEKGEIFVDKHEAAMQLATIRETFEERLSEVEDEIVAPPVLKTKRTITIEILEDDDEMLDAVLKNYVVPGILRGCHVGCDDGKRGNYYYFNVDDEKVLD